LQVGNRKTALISLAEESPPFIEGVETYHAPRGEELTFS
jgi:hypothetical protein